MATLWLLLTVGLPGATGLGLMSAGPRWRHAAGPLAILVNVLVLALATALWIDRPQAGLAWLPAGEDALVLHLSAAGTAAPLAVLVAAVALTIMVYSQGYMREERDRARFFGFMLLFVGAMELLTLADDLLTILIAFELVGLCSWGLIGFWHHETTRVVAANRALITTRTADLGLYLAAMAAFAGAGAGADGGGLRFAALPDLGSPYLDLVAAGLIVAAAGKSAQLPFSGWLSGAMLGPSPVSALLHSATMVAAGAIVLIKALPGLGATSWALDLILWVGIATALVGGAIALFQDDLKQLLAASTVSQFGFVFAGIGSAGAASAATYLVNHAAFKALLFLVAGILLHQGFRRFAEMGGLKRPMPVQAILFAAGALSLAALPPLGGFFAKEALLARVHEAGTLAYLALIVGSVLSAAYAGRAWLGAFAGSARSADVRKAHEPGLLLTLPAAVFALAALLLGALALPPLEPVWTQALMFSQLPPVSAVAVIVSLAASLAGGAVVWVLHRRGALVDVAPVFGSRAAASFGAWLGLVRVLDSIGWIAVLLSRALDRLDRIEPASRAGLAIRRLAHGLGRFDLAALDAASAGASTRGAMAMATLSRLTDGRVWEGAIAGLDRGLQSTAGRLSSLQNGLLHHYYALATAGIALLFVYALFQLA